MTFSWCFGGLFAGFQVLNHQDTKAPSGEKADPQMTQIPKIKFGKSALIGEICGHPCPLPNPSIWLQMANCGFFLVPWWLGGSSRWLGVH
jgi:hypothetical protein